MTETADYERAGVLGAHKTTHQDGGSDEISVLALSGLLADDQHVLDAEVKLIKLDDFATPDNNEDLNASTAKHGLLKKLSNVVTEFLNGQGGFSVPAGGAGSSSSAKTTNYTLLAADLTGLSTFTNDGAGAQINFTWPTLVAGQRARFIVVDAQYLKITAPSTKKFRFLSDQGAATGYIRSNTVGNVVECEATADDIVIVSISGAWSYDE